MVLSEDSMEDSVKLVQALNSGVVSFRYQKMDGTIREATGTRNAKYLNEVVGLTPSQSVITTDIGKMINYYDTEKQDWRRFDITRLV